MSNKAYQLLERINNFGDRATAYNLGLTGSNITEYKLIELMLSLELIWQDRSTRPYVYRVNECRMNEALLIDESPRPKRVRPKNEPKIEVAKSQKVRTYPPGPSTPHPDCQEWILQMLTVHGELCVMRQLMPLIDEIGVHQSKEQINRVLRQLMDQGRLSRRISNRRIHGTGVYVYRLIEAKTEAA